MLLPPGGTYSAGTEVALTAAAAPRYTFVSWGGDASGTNATTIINMDGDKAVTAHLKLSLP